VKDGWIESTEATSAWKYTSQAGGVGTLETMSEGRLREGAGKREG